VRAYPAGRPTWVEVDLAALRHNARQVRRLIGPRVKFLAVVKANAYGHGAVPCSRALLAAGADVLGVATVEEGAELRAAGLRAPIVVLGLAQPAEADEVVRLRLEATVTSWRQVAALNQSAARRGTTVGVHLKVDTGMGRIGLPPEAALAFLGRLGSAPRVRLAGVFTHFAHADGRDQQLLNWQLQRLFGVTRTLEAGVLVHAANSAAVIGAPGSHASMVRPGLMLYGLYPAPALRRRVPLKPALSWKTRIIELKTVPPHTGLSYGHTFVTARTSRIATLPVGYADGFARALSNTGQVLVRGRRCPVVGRVCMDMCLVDVTRVPGAALGDEAVLIGTQGAAVLPVEDMAARLETITYELVCTIGSRVPRRYAGGRP
jgi:alanine racemase